MLDLAIVRALFILGLAGTAAVLQPFQTLQCNSAAGRILIGLAKAGADPFLEVAVLLLMTYVGLILGAQKGDMLNLAALGGIFGGEKSGSKRSFKILDTSVIIDGRIADVAENGFLDRVPVIPPSL